jgi:hypothetical protein
MIALKALLRTLGSIPQTPSFNVFSETAPTTNNFSENITNIFTQVGAPKEWAVDF